jgi:hypothetical protein
MAPDEWVGSCVLIDDGFWRVSHTQGGESYGFPLVIFREDSAGIVGSALLSD